MKPSYQWRNVLEDCIEDVEALMYAVEASEYHPPQGLLYRIKSRLEDVMAASALEAKEAEVQQCVRMPPEAAPEQDDEHGPT